MDNDRVTSDEVVAYLQNHDPDVLAHAVVMVRRGKRRFAEAIRALDPPQELTDGGT